MTASVPRGARAGVTTTPQPVSLSRGEERPMATRRQRMPLSTQDTLRVVVDALTRLMGVEGGEPDGRGHPESRAAWEAAGAAIGLAQRHLGARAQGAREQRRNELGRWGYDHLVDVEGASIVEVGVTADSFGADPWPTLYLDDGRCLVLSRDPEGNGAGFAFVEDVVAS